MGVLSITPDGDEAIVRPIYLRGAVRSLTCCHRLAIRASMHRHPFDQQHETIGRDFEVPDRAIYLMHAEWR